MIGRLTSSLASFRLYLPGCLGVPVVLLLALLGGAPGTLSVSAFGEGFATSMGVVAPPDYQGIDDARRQVEAYRDLFPERMQFEHISVEKGLSNASVYAIHQDSRGFMWFGTEGGLNRYDGYTFTVYKHDEDDPQSLSNNVVLDIHEDRSGSLWLATFGGGINRYDPQADGFTHYRHDLENSQSLSSDYIVRIYEDREGIFWITTEGGGLNRFDPQTEAFTHYRHDPGDPVSISHDIVTRVLEDSHGVLWVGTDGGGLNRFDRRTETFTRFQHNPRDPTSISNDIIWSIVEDRQGTLWLGTFGGGINRFDPQREQFVHYRHDPDDPASLSTDDVRLLYEDGEGTLWVGTVGEGLERFDTEAETFVHTPAVPGDPKALQSGMIWSLYEDRTGLLWIGTIGDGLYTYSRRQANWIHVPGEPDNPGTLDGSNVGDILEDQAGNLWFATSGGGLDRFEPASGEFVHYHHDPQNPRTIGPEAPGPLIQDSSGILWVGTFGSGVSALDLSQPENLEPTTAEFIHYRDTRDPGGFHDIIWSLYADSTGTLWVGTQTGLDAHPPGAQRIIHYTHDPDDEDSLSNDVIRTIVEDRQGRIWIGTDVGLNRLERESGRFHHYTHDPDDEHTLSNNLVLTLHEDRSGILWVGTWGGGLNRFDPASERFQHYTEKEGLPDDSVLAIEEDRRGNLWLSTNKGLSQFDPRTETFRNYDSGDGLRSLGTGELLYARTGEILVADGSGFTIFDPQSLVSDPLPPPVALTLLSQGGEIIDLAPDTKEISLRWPHDFFEFEYAVLSYLRPEQNEYAYMLEGFDDDWVEMGTRRFGRYTNLPGGRYTLRVKGANSDGVWNEEGVSLIIDVVPPFWSTWWFRASVVLLALLTVGAAYGLRLRGLSEQRRRLEAEVARRTRELEALYAIAAEASRSLDLQEILGTSLHKTLEVLGVEAGGIYLLGENDQILTIAAHEGLAPSFVQAIDELEVGEGFSGRVVETGESVVLHDLANDPRLTREVVRHSNFQAAAVVPIGAKGRVFGSLFVISRRERTFAAEDLALLTSIGRQIGVATEHTRLFSAEQHRAEQFRVISEVGRRITSILDIDSLLHEMVRLIQQAFGYYHVGIGLIEGDEVVYRVGSGALWDDPHFDYWPAHLKIGEEGLSGWVAASGEPFLAPDVSQEPRYVWLRGSQTRSELVVPIKAKGEVIGVLDAQSDRLNAFDEVDTVVLQALAHQAGTAIENVRLYEQAQLAAVTAERTRLARELHDAVTQTLFSASLLAEALPQTWERDPREGRQVVAELRQLSRGALAEMRTLLLELRPAALVEADFGDLLRQLAEAASGREGLPVEVTVECRCHLPDDVHVALYRIAQEALNNVVKHARAERACVELHCSKCGTATTADLPQIVTLTISDDGRGFDLGNVSPEHMGLVIMGERAESVGATLAVTSQPGAGTQIEVQWTQREASYE